MKIPRIIHQIWSGIDEPLPSHFRELGETWKRDYPTWKYEFWDNDRMVSFIKEYYPQHWEVYNKYPYNIQRWDSIRYLILCHYGGMYVDFDYESIKPIDKLIEDQVCCFSLEPNAHCYHYRIPIVFNNALMLSIPQHPFIQHVIDFVFDTQRLSYDISPKKIVTYNAAGKIESSYFTNEKNGCVMSTTGPWALIKLYEKLKEEEKKNIYLIPAKYVTPFDGLQTHLFLNGLQTQELEDCLEEAHAIHYFFNDWTNTNT